MARAVADVKETGAESVAVCFLFSFLNPAHERRMGEALRAVLPGIDVSLSCEVQPEFREYERLSTTVLNAFLQPVAADTCPGSPRRSTAGAGRSASASASHREGSCRSAGRRDADPHRASGPPPVS
jgi:hypothetical protein